MLIIRLQRIGKTKRPSYRLVVSDKRRDTQAAALEILGQYQPVEKNKVVKLNTERVKYWLSVGAQTSDSLHNLFVKEGIISAPKRKSVYLTTRRKAKLAAKQPAPAAEPAAQTAESIGQSAPQSASSAVDAASGA